MIISFAFGMIGALLVLANSRRLRKSMVYILSIIFAALIAILGVYFIMTMAKETEKALLFPMFSPMTALILFQVTRWIYLARNKKEIIIYMYGLFPVKHDERYVTQQEKYITFTLLVLSVIIPYFILKLSL